MTLVIAIDGPAGTGKSSVARSLAKHFNFVYVDTGSIYRALAWLVNDHKVDPDDADEVDSLVPLIDIVLEKGGHGTFIKIAGSKIADDQLRTENISRLSSIVSRHKKVRESLLRLQRNLVNHIPHGTIFEGRDIGTVVFPKADLKIFITASSDTRAKRRYDEMRLSNPDVSYEEILKAIENRDERDKNRANAPMQRADDAHMIDTSLMTLEEVFKEAKDLIKSVMPHKD
jgi:cytidylate kinase